MAWLLLIATACGDAVAPAEQSAKPAPGLEGQAAPSEAAQAQPVRNYLEVIARDGSTRREAEVNGWILLEAALTRALGRELTRDQAAIVADFGRQRLSGWWPPDVMRDGRVSPVFGKIPPLPNDLDDTSWNLALQAQPFRSEELKRFLTQDPPRSELGVTLCQRAKVAHAVVLRTWDGADAEWRGDFDVVVIANALTRLDRADATQVTLFEDNARLVNEAALDREPERFAPNYEAKMTAFLLLYYDDQAHFLSATSRAGLLARWRSLRSGLTETVTCYGPCTQPTLIDGHVYRYVNEAIPALAREYAARWYP